MPRLRQVSRAEAPPEVAAVYDRLFGDRDPVAEPGDSDRHARQLVDRVRAVPGRARARAGRLRAVQQRSRAADAVPARAGARRARASRAGASSCSRSTARPPATPASRRRRLRDMPAWSTTTRSTPQTARFSPTPTNSCSTAGRVQDATFAALRDILSDEAILELDVRSRDVRHARDDLPRPAPGVRRRRRTRGGDSGAGYGSAADVMGTISR